MPVNVVEFAFLMNTWYYFFLLYIVVTDADVRCYVVRVNAGYEYL